MSSRPLTSLRRPGALLAAGAVAAVAAIGLASGGLFASACTETLAQPDDAGNFVEYEGGHPPPSMYGSPCNLEPERCCGVVAKEVPGDQCYGCLGRIAYALCVGGAFTCACTCDPPVGYSLVGPGGGSADCGSSATDGAVGEAAAETSLADSTLSDSGPEASRDAADGGG